MTTGDLEARSLVNFDALFQFRIADSLNNKPWTSKSSKVENAFSDTDPRFSLGHFGPKHKLILNKYSVVRPQFVLHTIEFEPQSDALNIHDMNAMWDAFSSLKSPHIAIFNCGHEADEDYEVPEVPFKHSIHRIGQDIDGPALLRVYEGLRQSLALGPESPHNVILVKDWMVVIPRLKARNGMLSANAAAMIGMVWVNSEEQYNAWIEYGPMKALTDFGVPSKKK
ncbi:hypothetical protein SLS56_004071 [Neofusicoccum ribis]|uniref:Uncharacterized protein n=1 Tax=Neofusicoccum ribis TaxID=45134 RepID=A0ABR3SZ65_9PEZI